MGRWGNRAALESAALAINPVGGEGCDRPLDLASRLEEAMSNNNIRWFLSNAPNQRRDRSLTFGNTTPDEF